MTLQEELFDKWYVKSMQYWPIRIPKLSRERLIGYFGEFGFTKGAEIGVDRGRFSSYMLETIPDLHLICVDPWRRRQRGKSRFNSTMERLEPYLDRVTIIKKTGMDAYYDVPDESLDFVYIDGDHTFDMVMLDLILWGKKVKFGGIISGHDYYAFGRAGIITAVNAYTRAHGVEQWFVTDYQKSKDRTPSFFWIKKPSFGDPLPEAENEEE
jgi:hypothetical protein